MNARPAAASTMPTAAPAGLRGQLAQRRQHFNTRFNARERLAIGVVLGVLGVLLVWSVALRPAWRTLTEAPRQLDLLDAQLQAMQRLAAESRSLRGATPVAAAQATAALQSATQRLGDPARLSLQGDRATVTLSGVAGPALQAWLGEVRSAARGRVVDAQLTRGPNGYAGSVVVMLGSGS